MANLFKGSEIVELGVQIEKNGMDFYGSLSRESKDQDAIKIFKYLTGEEEKHIAVFQKILEGIEKYQPPESYPGEYFAYMNALASDYIFTQNDKGEIIAKRIKSDIESVDLGIGFEKDSIIFYYGMKKAVPENDCDIIDGLIMQEQKHLKELLDLKKQLQGVINK